MPPEAPPLRVAYVTMRFPAASETFACLDVRELSEKGATIAVHCLRPTHAEVPRLAEERGVRHIACSYNSVGASLCGLGAMLRTPGRALETLSWLVRRTWRRPVHLGKSLVLLARAFDILAALECDPPDVVHVYWGHYPALVGRLVQRYVPATAVSMSLGAYDLEARYPPTVDVARHAAFVRTHGECNVGAIVERVGIARGRVRVIANGTDLSLVDERAGEALRVPGRIVTAGRLIPVKAMDDVLRAFAVVRGRRPDATLDILGAGTEQRRLETLAADLGVADAVVFRGHVPHADVFRYLARAEIFLFLSRSPGERLPNVVKEAMASGAACVSSDTTGIDELILDPGMGRVVPRGAVDAAAAAVLDLLADPDALARVRTRARAHVAAHFDVRTTTNAYLRLWRAAVEAKRDDLPAPVAVTPSLRPGL